MKTISKQEYLKALQTVELYRDQQNIGREQVADWIRKHDVSTKLYKALRPRDFYGNLIKPPFKYVDEINKREFMMIKNVGINTWIELRDLLEK